MKIIDAPSPSFNDRPPGTKVSLFVVHGTVGTDEGDLAYLKKGGEPRRRVSYHYLVLRTGAIHRLVAPEKRAWACDPSSWKGRSGVNDYSISVGLSHLNDGKPYTDAQYRACAWLYVTLAKYHPIPLEGIVGHYNISPGRKTDPWYVFHWGRLFAEIDKLRA